MILFWELISMSFTDEPSIPPPLVNQSQVEFVSSYFATKISCIETEAVLLSVTMKSPKVKLFENSPATITSPFESISTAFAKLYPLSPIPSAHDQVPFSSIFAINPSVLDVL